jgi:hypothetical protein
MRTSGGSTSGPAAGSGTGRVRAPVRCVIRRHLDLGGQLDHDLEPRARLDGDHVIVLSQRAVDDLELTQAGPQAEQLPDPRLVGQRLGGDVLPAQRQGRGLLLRLLGHFGTQPDGAGGLDALDGRQELAEFGIGCAPARSALLVRDPVDRLRPICRSRSAGQPDPMSRNKAADQAPDFSRRIRAGLPHPAGR